MSPDVGRFTTIDPMAEKYYSISPYAYCADNPIILIDPTGMIWENPEEAKELENNIEDRISFLNKSIQKLEIKISKGGLSEKKMNKYNDKIEDYREQSPNSRTPIFDLNISELPLNKKETGNTLETRGLTYSYTFLTKPKNAHLGCKDTKQIPSCQMVSYTFFKFIAIFIFIGIQTTLFGHSDEQNPVCHFTYISVPSHCSHL